MGKKGVIGNWFYGNEGDKKKEQPAAPTAAPQAVPIAPPSSTFVPSAPLPGTQMFATPGPAPIAGVFDQDTYNLLMKELDSADLPGPDMLEFMKAYRASMTMPVDDNTRIKMVLNTLLTAGGAKIEQITTSVSHYMSVLDGAKDKFNKAIAATQSTEVTAKEQQLASLQKANEDKLAQIQQLNADIATNNQTSAELQTQVAQSKAKVEQSVAKFQATLDAVKAELQNYLIKIQNIGKI